MGEKFTSRVGYLIRNFRIASDMTQKELADKCGLNESTIRNYELGNSYTGILLSGRTEVW